MCDVIASRVHRWSGPVMFTAARTSLLGPKSGKASALAPGIVSPTLIAKLFSRTWASRSWSSATSLRRTRSGDRPSPGAPRKPRGEHLARGTARQRERPADAAWRSGSSFWLDQLGEAHAQVSHRDVQAHGLAGDLPHPLEVRIAVTTSLVLVAALQEHSGEIEDRRPERVVAGDLVVHQEALSLERLDHPVRRREREARPLGDLGEAERGVLLLPAQQDPRTRCTAWEPARGSRPASR